MNATPQGVMINHGDKYCYAYAYPHKFPTPIGSLYAATDMQWAVSGTAIGSDAFAYGIVEPVMHSIEKKRLKWPMDLSFVSVRFYEESKILYIDIIFNGILNANKKNLIDVDVVKFEVYDSYWMTEERLYELTIAGVKTPTHCTSINMQMKLVDPIKLRPATSFPPIGAADAMVNSMSVTTKIIDYDPEIKYATVHAPEEKKEETWRDRPSLL